MRQIILLVFVTLTISAFGQIEPLKGKVNPIQYEKIGYDTTLQVSYGNPNNPDRSPALFINGKFSIINTGNFKAINPDQIDGVRVVKKDTVIEGQKYFGQLYIQLKKDYHPKLISLADLKLKYTNQTKAPYIFMIDNELISGDYRKCIVDEKYILKIVVENIVNKEKNRQVNVIRLLTKTEENIKKSKEIRIRGTEGLMQER